MNSSVNQDIATATSTSSSRPAPGEGERGAVAGYYKQYQYSAVIILKQLRHGQLDWIRVADPQAGRVDDILIGTAERIDAYQVKTEQYPGLFTFHDLTTPQGKPPLITQLAQGWYTLREQNPNKLVVVHLVTNLTPSNSSNANIPLGPTQPTPKHFAAFVNQVWEPAHRTRLDSEINIPDEWLNAWIALQKQSELPTIAFDKFVRNCKLEFRARPYLDIDIPSTREQQFATEAVDNIANLIFSTVAGPEREIEMSREQLLERLNWTDNFEYRSSHHFPLQNHTYQEIDSSATELMVSIDTNAGGYIAVMGSPGSGKSTLLTNIRARSKLRWISYYAYIPDDPHSRNLRGESVSFLHDVTLALERSGFRVGITPNRFDRSLLLERFHRLLKLLNEDWCTTGRKTVIVIDGLDFIERELSPTQSLLNDLPDPDQVPDGVYFVLGTQTDTPLKPNIRAMLHRKCQPGRTVYMSPLTRPQVNEVVDAANLPTELDATQRRQIYDVSDGHPLYLNYLIKEIRLRRDPTALVETLQSATQYSGDIETIYYGHWQRFCDDMTLVMLLGMFARVKGVIDITWVRTWADFPTLQKLIRQFSHYFRIENATRWYFFHDSFRQFLTDRTCEAPLGGSDSDVDRYYHAQLALHCADSAPEHILQRWNELHHRATAGEHSKVLTLATQLHFRTQFLEFRPLDAIRADILNSIAAAVECQDLIAMIRLCLVGSEMCQRGDYHQPARLASLLLRTASHELALLQLRDGLRLRVDAVTALRVVKPLIQAGLAPEARRIFELAEPLDLLAGVASNLTNEPYDQNPSDLGQVLQEWAKAAACVKDVAKTIDVIQAIPFDSPDLVKLLGMKLSSGYGGRLLFEFGVELIAQERSSDLDIVLNALDTNDPRYCEPLFWLLFRAYEQSYNVGELRAASIYCTRLLELDRQCFHKEHYIALADCACRLLQSYDLATSLLTNAVAASDAPGPEMTWSELPSHDFLFRKLRLMQYLRFKGRLPDEFATTTVSGSDSDVRVERALNAIAYIWESALAGQKMVASSIRQWAWLLRLYYHHPVDMANHEQSPFQVYGSKTRFYQLLVMSVAPHGPDALGELRTMFDQEWNNPRQSQFWPPEVKRSLICEFIGDAESNNWIVETLRDIDQTIPSEQDIQSWVEEGFNQSDAWIRCGNFDNGMNSLHKALGKSFGVGYRKDYQMEQWIDSLDKVNRVEPHLAIDRIRWFSVGTVHLYESTEGRAAYRAAQQLLAIAFRHSPACAPELLTWFERQNLLSHWGGISVLIEEAMQLATPPLPQVSQLVTEFLLPYNTTADSHVLRDLVTQLGTQLNHSEVIKGVRLLVNQVRSDTVPSQRSEWMNGLIEGLARSNIVNSDAGLTSQEVEDASHSDVISNTLELEGEPEQLQVDEVLTRVNSVLDVRDLLAKETNHSYFNWLPVVKELCHSLRDVDDLTELAQTFGCQRNASRILTAISARLNQLGFKQHAWQIGTDALNRSSFLGWYIWSEETRVETFRTLNQIDRNRTSKLIWQTLLTDLREHFDIVVAIVSALDDICELLDPTARYDVIWPEIGIHIKPLLQTTDFDCLPTLFQHDVSKVLPGEMFLELILGHIDHPCQVLQQAAQRSICNLLLDDASQVFEVVQTSLSLSETHQEGILIALDAVSLSNPNIIDFFRGQIYALYGSPNFQIRSIAKSIGQRLNWPAPSHARKLESPHPTYVLTFPDHEFADLAHTRTNDDPSQFISLFQTEITRIATAANVPIENVVQRVISIIHSLVPHPSVLSMQAEKELQSTLNSVGVRLAYHRPRFCITRRAIFHTLAELIDCGMVTAQSACDIGVDLRTYDPYFVRAESKQRPSQISRMSVSAIGFSPKDWVMNASESLPHIVWCPNGNRKLVAEVTCLSKKSIGRSLMEERHSALVVEQKFPLGPGKSLGSIFASATNAIVTEYPSLSGTRKPHHIVVRNQTFGFNSSGSNWLALDPIVGYQCGWKVSDSGMFRWVDCDNNVMVESIWWRDGRSSVYSASEYADETSEGWLVVASESALAQIQRDYGQVVRKAIVVRRFDERGNVIKHRADG